ncbi:hypothetical protein ACFY40_09290 [Streptomyces sp. NPDC012950]
MADLAAVPVTKLGPMRGLNRRREQRHRPGPLLALDFAGDVVEASRSRFG